MKNLILIFSLALITLSSCSEQKDQYHLSGQIDGLGEQQMILQFVNFKENVDIDTTTSDANGNYTFEGKVAEPGFYRISANGKFWMLRLDNETIVYNAEFADDQLNNVEILKSEKAKDFQEVIKFFITKQTEMNQISTEYQTKSMAQASPAELKAIENKYLLMQKNLMTEVKEKLENTSDPITAFYLMSALQNEDEFDYFKSKVEEYATVLPNSIYIKQYQEQVKGREDQLAQQAAMEAASNKIGIGTEAPEIVQKNPQGADLKLSDLRGKVVLIDFWASWCKPCRYENPNVVAAYNAYKDKGFTVFNVSLDKDRQAWINAIAQDGLVWPNHVSDLQFWNNAAAKDYGVQGIPAAFLIDENGVIIGKDLRGQALEDKLKEVLG